MKKCFLFITALVLALSLVGCEAFYYGTVVDGIIPKDGITIVTTNFFLYDAARTIARDRDNVIMLISPGAESHDFELTLADMAAIETCDLFAYVGGEGEGWVYDALDTFGENGIEVPTFCAMEAVEEAGTLVHSAGEHDHDHDSHEHSHWEGIDDHVWLSIPNALVIYEAMLDTLRGYYEDWWDPAADEAEQDSADNWKYRLTMLDEKFRTLTESLENPSILVADRFPFAYLTETYGIAYAAAFEGCTSDTEPSLDTVNRLISLTETLSPRTILVTELSDRQTASSIAAQVNGVTIAELHSCHNVTKEDFENGVTYFDLMERNYTVLENLWNR